MRLILGPDAPLISEMSTTTEVSDMSGNCTYHPLIRNQEHRTDALRCIAIGIRDLPREADQGPHSYGGWANYGNFGPSFRGSGITSDYRPPWDHSTPAPNAEY